MSTGTLPTFVNSTNSPLAPPYMYSVMRSSAFADAASIGSTSTQSQAVNRFEIDVMTAPDMRTPERRGRRRPDIENPRRAFVGYRRRPRAAAEVFRERVTAGLHGV